MLDAAAIALLPEGAGEHVDLVAGGDVVGDGHARGQQLVVGMGVDEEEASGPPFDDHGCGRRHRETPMTPISGTPP